MERGVWGKPGSNSSNAAMYDCLLSHLVSKHKTCNYVDGRIEENGC
jgi:hypothetical protein